MPRPPLSEFYIDTMNDGTSLPPSGRQERTVFLAQQARGLPVLQFESKSLDEIPAIDYDYVVTMGCGDACPFVSAKNRLDWQIPDPKHMNEEEFAGVRDLIGEKVKDLIEKTERE